MAKPLYDERDRNRILAKGLLVPSGCWEWQGYVNNMGYGLTSIRKQGGGHMNRLVHRLYYVIHKGLRDFPILCVLHKCDNPKCFNPDHMFLGTRKDNSEDMRSKGRSGGQGPGSNHTLAKLDEAKVLDIRKRAERGEAHIDIAQRYGVAKKTVSKIVQRGSWRHV